jgi:hypothetical protein
VGQNIQASKSFAGDPHSEIHVATNPRNPLNLVGGAMVWNQKKNMMTVIAYTSFDGGQSWTPTLTFDDNYFHSDPAADSALTAPLSSCKSPIPVSESRNILRTSIVRKMAASRGSHPLFWICTTGTTLPSIKLRESTRIGSSLTE